MFALTVTTETKTGLTVTTDVTVAEGKESPVAVTWVTNSLTGERASEENTVKALAVNAVSTVAFGHLAQALREAEAAE